MPSVSNVDIDIALEPAERSAAVKGEYTFYNHRDYPYPQIPITAGQWDPIEWTLNGEEHEPDDRSNLFVFTPDTPLGTGDSLRIGFSYELEFPRGMSKRAGGEGQFILESGVVLTAFAPTFVPVPGYLSNIGVDDDNSYEPRDYPDDFYVGETEPLFGWGGEPFSVRTRITTPAEYTANGVGQKVSDEVVDGRRTVVWETGDYPVDLFNVVAGKYAVKEGNGTAIYYHPEHDYNIEEMSAALDAARQYYSEWFFPLPVGLVEDLGVPGVRGVCTRFSDEHHLQRRDRISCKERPALPRGVHGGCARSCASMVGQSTDTGPRSGRQHPLRRDVALRDDASPRAGVR